MRILLLNPPGKQLYTRDYYCSKTSKANYRYHPVDLLMLSGILDADHQLRVMDAVAEDLSPEAALGQIISFQPEIVVCLTGAVSWEEDRGFMSLAKEKTGALILASGDILLENGEKVLDDFPVLDVIILDFTSPDILEWLRGNREQDYPSLLYRDESGQLRGHEERVSNGGFTIPVPRHDLFPFKKYRYPFVKREPFATVLTDYGCPFKCSFCVMPHLGYKTRPVENVMAELRLIKQLGIKEIYFNDQTFGVNKQRGKALAQAMIDEDFRFGWVCFSRVDLVDQEYLKIMKKAGCHSLIFGVESGNDATLKRYNKGFSAKQVEETFALCRRLGFDIIATFVLGLPGETEEDLLRTIKFSKKIKCDYASFNVVVPRMGTQVRREAVAAGLVDPNEMRMDQTGSFAVMGTKELTSARLLEVRERAVKSFYLRPSYLVRRLLKIRSWFDLKNQLGEGWALLQKNLR